MKLHFVFTFLFSLLLGSNSLSAQQSSDKAVILSAERLILRADKKVTTLEGYVSLKTDKLNVSKAKWVEIAQESNKIIVFGESNFEFSGLLITLPSSTSGERRLEYTIGENVAYIK